MALPGIHNPFCVPDLSTSKPTTMQSIRLHIKSLKRRGAYGRLEVLYNPIRKFWHFINFRIKEQADLENRIKYVCKHLGVRRKQVIPVEHHRAHGYYALYASFNFLHENLEGYRFDVIVDGLRKFVKDMFGLRYRMIGEFLIVKS